MGNWVKVVPIWSLFYLKVPNIFFSPTFEFMPQIFLSSLRSVLGIKIFACGAFYNNWLLFVVFYHLYRKLGPYFSVFHLNRIISLYFSVVWSLFGTYFRRNGSLFGSLLGTFFCRDLSCQHWMFFTESPHLFFFDVNIW